ncbi:MAG: hypothetical protein OEW82_05040, partial [Dehalococcoidia bacterium]|nr:hypothetical protein [Dehalococcoidia bacterium]
MGKCLVLGYLTGLTNIEAKTTPITRIYLIDCFLCFHVSTILSTMALKAIEWLDDKLRILDQSKLPWEQSFVDLAGYQDVALAIKEMRIRGAPAIGVAAAYGIALGAQDIKTTDEDDFLNQLNRVMQTLATTRPTAVNLFQAINRMSKITAIGGNIPEIKEALIAKAKQIHQEEIE